MSSGTPAMKSSMILLKILLTDINIKLIQVSSPKKKSNANTSHEKISKDEEVELKMSKLIESENDEKKLGLDLNRCTEEDLNETIKIVTIENIKKMLLKRDFCGIYNLIEERKELFNENILNYSKHLYYRYIGETKNALEIAKKLGQENELYPIKDEKTKRIIEKYDILTVKLERHEYQDYLIGLGPIIEEIVRRDNNIDILKLKKYYFNLYETLQNRYNITNNDGWKKLNWYTTVRILEAIYTEQDIAENIPEKVKSIEKYRTDRNIVAHTLGNTKYNSKEFEKVHQNLKFLITRIKTGQDENFKKAIGIYEYIEKILIDLLDKSIIENKMNQ